MADEVNLAFITPGTDADLLKQWRAQPPAFLAPDRYKLFDESYDTLVFRANVSTKTMKIMTWGWGKTLYTLSFTFRPDREGTTRVSVLGQASEATRTALMQYATAHQAT
jgi:hypothetical protein